MSLKQVLVAVSLVLVAGSVSADVVPVGPFTGTYFEGFENIGTPGSYSGPMSIFGGTATVDDAMIHMVVIAYSWQGPAGQVLPYGGNLMGGNPVHTTIFQFAAPVAEFGGYFVTVGALPDGTAVFYDIGGAVIGTLPFSVAPAVWGWQGWHSDILISRIELTGNNGIGFGLIYDDLELTPELAILGDMNCDGLVNAFDIDPFVLALTSAPEFAAYYAAYPECNAMNADTSQDGQVNAFDIDPFVALLTGP